MSIFNEDDIKKNADKIVIDDGIKKLVIHYSIFLDNLFIRDGKMYDMRGQELHENDIVAAWNNLHGCWTFYVIEKICKNIIKAHWYYRTINNDIALSLSHSNLKPHCVLKVDTDFINNFVNGLGL